MPAKFCKVPTAKKTYGSMKPRLTGSQAKADTPAPSAGNRLEDNRKRSGLGVGLSLDDALLQSGVVLEAVGLHV